MDNKHYLPIGTVIKLKDVDKPLIIIGYGGKIEEKNIKYDYIAYPYPNGFISVDKNFVFNADEIGEILFEGYKDEKYEEMLTIVKGGNNNEE